MPWQRVKRILAQKLSERDFGLWIEPLRCVKADLNCIELAGSDPYFCAWVRDAYLSDIREAAQEACGAGMEVRLGVAKPAAVVAAPLPPQPEPQQGQEQLRLPNMPVGRSSVRTLHPRYTFDEFMVGESNAMAHAACEAIANGGESHGPCLFIEAGHGLGKSHLTHAVAHHITTHYPGTRLHYVTSQQLTAEMVRNIKHNTMEAFKEKYHHHCDVLLMEDVQGLAGKTKTQAELAEALDVLMECGKRVVFTGSAAPRRIGDLEDGIRSRLSSGLITTINPPDRRTRALIIERKAKNHRIQLNEELVELLVNGIEGDIRQVESAIVGLKAKAALRKMLPDQEMVREVLAGIVGQRQDLSAVMIRDFIADQYNVPLSDLLSKSRKKTVAFPRQVSMYLARKLTDEALSEIGKAFNRDHSTVVHSIRVITEAIAGNGSIRGQIEHLAARLKKQG
ncbi:MAG: chromosomal replication initiator protein DnaA [Thermodesulfobacteriota bacterium]